MSVCLCVNKHIVYKHLTNIFLTRKTLNLSLLSNIKSKNILPHYIVLMTKHLLYK